MTQTPESDRLNTLEATLTRFAELSFQSYRHHDEALSRLEANVERLEIAVTDLTTNQQQTNRSLEALSRTQVECLQLIAANTIEISRIWQYLERQTGNGRSGDSGQAN